MEENHNIEEKIRQLLEKNVVDPKLSSFDAILQKMRKRKRRRFLIFFFSGLLFVSGTFFFLPREKSMEYASFPSQSNGPSRAPSVASKPRVALLKEHSTPALLPAADTSDRVQEKSLTTGTLPAKDILGPAARKSPWNSKQVITRLPQDKIIVPMGRIEADPPLDSLLTKPAYPLTLPIPSSEGTAITDSSHLVDSTKEAVIFLPLVLPIAIAPPDTLRKGAEQELLLTKNKKLFNFYVGIRYTPGFNRYGSTTVPQSSPAFYHTLLQSLSSSGKTAGPFYFGSSVGLTAGLRFRKKYELLVSAGLQYFHGVEKNYWLAPFNSLNNQFSSLNFSSAPDPNSLGGYSYRYVYYALEMSRIFRINTLFNWKFGGAVQFNKVTSGFVLESNQVNFYTVDLKVGVVAKLSKRLEFQLNPSVFFAPGSMFANSLIFKQYPYGFRMEATVVFRVF